MEKKLAALLDKYHRNECTDEEIRRLEAWYEEIAKDQPGKEPDEHTVHTMLTAIKRSPRFHAAKTGSRRPLWLSLRRYTAIAASLFFVLAISIFIYRQTLGERSDSPTSDIILPGSDKAILTLADGTRIALDGIQEGVISNDNGVTISKNRQGVLEYRTTSQDHASTLQTNTLATPRGGSYQIVLPDGSKAWLNAASSLSYPTVFSNHERRVRMTGEVYFDIAESRVAVPGQSDERVPFLVETDRQTIQVLGTQFNVNSYTSYPTERTTLVTGKVKVISRTTGDYEVLSPHMQAQVGARIHVENADVARAIAWKNGDFIFRNERLSDILEEVIRWYDVEVSCPEHLGKIRFNGMVSRKQPLSAILDMIAATEQVKLEVKERRIIVKE
ncbi:FecR domain-containing protein [Parapedobacter sp. ISTM3]|uniref:FecR family protein n=1 Tax=Parapedobacter sp. ISTM3 TaxID=2800130 RepID=UPI00190565D2|nr:FecR domain-containing protein [Parapedobacter sp. ISTM3]MBK1439620.1 FecR domain-containing protein [Parapedobacter sp. ISTM3]